MPDDYEKIDSSKSIYYSPKRNSGWDKMQNATDQKKTTLMAWETDKNYAEGDEVYVLNEFFTCATAHKSHIFGNDFFGNDKNPGRYWRRGRRTMETQT